MSSYTFMIFLAEKVTSIITSNLLDETKLYILAFHLNSSERNEPGILFADRFTVLSYNILADYLATDHRGKLYFHVPRYMMDWEWRKKNILFELGLWSADILCFQVSLHRVHYIIHTNNLIY